MVLHSTYTVKAPDVVNSSFFGREFFDLIKNGEYLFVDEHFVYNAPLYIDTGENGDLILSEYARNHIDECCVKFTWNLTYRDEEPDDFCGIKGYWNGPAPVRLDLYTGCPDITFRIEFNNGWNNAPPDRQVAMRQKMLDEQIEIRRKMTDDPKQCMDLLLEWRDMNYTDIGKAIGRDPKTISRIAKGETTPTLETAVLICFVLHLPPLLSEKFLDVLGCRFDPLNKNHRWILEALYLKYPESLKIVKRYLSQYGVELN